MKSCCQRVTDLVGYDRKIIQDDNMLAFSVDSLLLANFVTINSKVLKILDLGVGIGSIPLILSLRTKAKITGVDIQKEVCDVALKNMKLNNIDGQVDICNDDMISFSVKSKPNSYDIIVCNPPFFGDGYNKFPSLNSKKISRHEESMSLEDIFKVSKKLLKDKGRLAMIFRVDRLVDVLSLFRKYNIEAKKIRFIHHNKDKSAKLFFVEGMKNGNAGLEILNPFIMYEGDCETVEYKKLLSEVNK